jgi:hypothetical protein
VSTIEFDIGMDDGGDDDDDNGEYYGNDNNGTSLVATMGTTSIIKGSKNLPLRDDWSHGV